MRCKRCGIEANDQVLTPEGPHYGKVVCAQCRGFLAWLPRPALPVDPAKLPKFSGELPILNGVSQRQIDFGTRCREQMLPRLQAALTQELFEAAQTITDATFWIANNDKPAQVIKWPMKWS